MDTHLLAPLKTLEPTVVYHYTSIDTLMKIVDSQQIRATSVAYLNDTKEREIFLEAAENCLPHFLKEHTELDENKFNYFLESRKRKNVPNTVLPFVASFCREPDSLPQWRAYCSKGNGVSIGFRVTSLQRALVAIDRSFLSVGEQPVIPPLSFGPVKYLGEFSTPQIFAGLQDAYDKEGFELTSLYSESLAPRRGSKICWSLEDQATLYKNETFSSEEEYRIVVPEIVSQPGVVHFRCNSSTLVPYVNLDIPYENGDYRREDTHERPIKTGWDAITSVWVGPTADKHLTQRSLESYFTSLRMKVEVEVTDSSYRDW